MKKNLRIVSAAAAALLAVAPVAASATVANAAVNFENNQTPTVSENSQKIAVNVNLGDINGKTVKQLEDAATVSANLSGANLTVKKGYKVAITGNGITSSNTDTFVPSKNAGKYTVTVTSLNIDGLINSGSYSAQTGYFGSDSSNKSVNGSSFTADQTYTDSFTIDDSKAVGTPYFATVGSTANPSAAVSTGAVSVDYQDNKSSINAVVSKIVATYQAAVDVNNGSLASDQTAAVISSNFNDDVTNAVKSGLTAAGITADTQGNFTIPANSFTVNVTVKANNGKTATLPIIVSFGKGDLSLAEKHSYPRVVYNNNNYYADGNDISNKIISTDKFNKVALNGSVDTDAIKKAFTAYVNYSDNSILAVNVNTSKVNTAVAGVYPVTVSAKNPAGKTTTVTFNVTVGDPNAKMQVAHTEGNIYTINGNTVTKGDKTVKSGDNIATYGEVTVNGVKYTRINGENADQFVESSVFTAPAKEESVSARVMYKSAIYDKDGKKTDKSAIAGYTDKDFVKDDNGNVKVYTINGETFAKIANEDSYVRARNVEGLGSKMTLKHNAYVYKSNGKRANKKVLKKGSTITVYGGQCTMKGYSKKTARIGVNQYVKVANIKTWSLAK